MIVSPIYLKRRITIYSQLGPLVPMIVVVLKVDDKEDVCLNMLFLEHYIKRGRSPDPDCADCLPISKRITRLNIQSTGRTSTENQDKLSPQCLNPVHGQHNIRCCDNPWQPEASSFEFLTIHGNNNNINSLPCGSSQCDSAHNPVTKNNINAYAVHHGIPKEDLTGYSPELSQTENPHYFQINRLLYQAHLEKAHREGMTLKNPF